MAYRDKKEMYQYNNKYNAKAYDRISVIVPKGMRKSIKAFADYKQTSVNSLIRELIEEAMNLETESGI